MFFQAKQNAVNGFVTHIVQTNKECPRTVAQRGSENSKARFGLEEL